MEAPPSRRSEEKISIIPQLPGTGSTTAASEVGEEGPTIEPQVHPLPIFIVPPEYTYYLHKLRDWTRLLGYVGADIPSTLGLSVRLDGVPDPELAAHVEGSFLLKPNCLAISLDRLDTRANVVVNLFDYDVVSHIRLVVGVPPTENAVRRYIDAITGATKSTKPRRHLTHLELYLGMDACVSLQEETAAPVGATAVVLMPIADMRLQVLRIRAHRARLDSLFFAELSINAQNLTELDLRSLLPVSANTRFASMGELEMCATSFPALRVLGLDLNGEEMEYWVRVVKEVIVSRIETLRIGCGPIKEPRTLARVLSKFFIRLDSKGVDLSTKAIDEIAMEKWEEVRPALDVIWEERINMLERARLSIL